VGGERDSSIVVQTDAPQQTVSVLLRNGAVENTVLVQAGAWRDEIKFGPGEERRIEVPLNHQRGATRLRFTTSAGFRPSEVDPSSRDTRFLGVWVKLAN
jgi:hypothetical protein